MKFSSFCYVKNNVHISGAAGQAELGQVGGPTAGGRSIGGSGRADAVLFDDAWHGEGGRSSGLSLGS